MIACHKSQVHTPICPSHSFHNELLYTFYFVKNKKHLVCSCKVSLNVPHNSCPSSLFTCYFLPFQHTLFPHLFYHFYHTLFPHFYNFLSFHAIFCIYQSFFISFTLDCYTECFHFLFFCTFRIHSYYFLSS